MTPTREPTSAHICSVCYSVGISFVAKAECRELRAPPAKTHIHLREEQATSLTGNPSRGLTRGPSRGPTSDPSRGLLGTLPPQAQTSQRRNPQEQLLAKKLSLSLSCPYSSTLCSLVLRSASLVSTSVGRLHAKGSLERRSREPSQLPLEPWHPLALFRSPSNILVPGVIALGGWPLTT